MQKSKIQIKLKNPHKKMKIFSACYYLHIKPMFYYIIRSDLKSHFYNIIFYFRCFIYLYIFFSYFLIKFM